MAAEALKVLVIFQTRHDTARLYTRLERLDANFLRTCQRLPRNDVKFLPGLRKNLSNETLTTHDHNTL